MAHFTLNNRKQQEIEVYSKFMETMQDALGREITAKTFDHSDWNEEEAAVLFRIV